MRCWAKIGEYPSFSQMSRAMTAITGNSSTIAIDATARSSRRLARSASPPVALSVEKVALCRTTAGWLMAAGMLNQLAPLRIIGLFSFPYGNRQPELLCKIMPTKLLPQEASLFFALQHQSALRRAYFVPIVAAREENWKSSTKFP